MVKLLNHKSRLCNQKNNIKSTHASIYWFSFVKKVEVKQLVYINIVLIIVSFILVVKLPFHVFLLTCAALGLHQYRTKIGWLTIKNHFTTHKKDTWLPVFLSVLLTLGFAYHLFVHFRFTYGSIGLAWVILYPYNFKLGLAAFFFRCVTRFCCIPTQSCHLCEHTQQTKKQLRLTR